MADTPDLGSGAERHVGSSPTVRIMKYSRCPRTTQERRKNGKRNFIIWDEYVVSIRPSRNQSNLVEAHDDIWARSSRSWKKHRKDQYKN